MKSKLLSKIATSGCFAVTLLALYPHSVSAQAVPAQDIDGPIGYPNVVTGEAWRLWRVPLVYTTPDFILDEIKQAYRPSTGGNEGMASLTKGKSDLGLTSTLPGLGAIIPNRRDNSLLIFATAEGYAISKQMVKILDIPALPPVAKHPLLSKPKPAQRPDVTHHKSRS